MEGVPSDDGVCNGAKGGAFMMCTNVGAASGTGGGSSSTPTDPGSNAFYTEKCAPKDNLDFQLRQKECDKVMMADGVTKGCEWIGSLRYGRCALKSDTSIGKPVTITT